MPMDKADEKNSCIDDLTVNREIQQLLPFDVIIIYGIFPLVKGNKTARKITMRFKRTLLRQYSFFVVDSWGWVGYNRHTEEICVR